MKNPAPSLIALVLLFAGAPVSVEAGFIKEWQLREAAAEPVLVVGRVLGVQKGERAGRIAAVEGRNLGDDGAYRGAAFVCGFGRSRSG